MKAPDAGDVRNGVAGQQQAVSGITMSPVPASSIDSSTVVSFQTVIWCFSYSSRARGVTAPTRHNAGIIRSRNEWMCPGGRSMRIPAAPASIMPLRKSCGSMSACSSTFRNLGVQVAELLDVDRVVELPGDLHRRLVGVERPHFELRRGLRGHQEFSSTKM